MMANVICKFCAWEFDPADTLTYSCEEHHALVCPVCHFCQAAPVTDAVVFKAHERRRVTLTLLRSVR